jgi:hypothetical protein
MNNLINARDLGVNTSYIHIDRENDKETHMGKLMGKGELRMNGIGFQEPVLSLTFESSNTPKDYEWDDKFKPVPTSGGKRKSRRKQKSKKAKKSKSRKTHRKSNRRR